MTSGTSTIKKPWYKKWWVWVIVAAVIVIGVIGNLVSDDDAPQAQPTETVEPTPPTTTTTTTPTEEPPPDDATRAAALEQSIKDAFGGAQFVDIFTTDPTIWAGWITGVRVDNGDAYITLQIASNDPDRDALGERAAKALPALLPEEATEGLSWIIVEDASGVVIEQTRLT